MKSTYLFACMLLGCTRSAGEETPESSGEAKDEGQELAGPGGEQAERAGLAPAKPRGAPLQRTPERASTMTEVWLDGRASAALSLDAEGRVSLWPALPPAQTELAALAPIRVPIREPLSLSLARAGEHEFVIAAIDTAQSARVIAIELDALGQASVRERFSIAPNDPLLELHVLEGGDRLLALGVDHRIRLYDGQGKQLAELAEYGLAPWQLRLAGPPEAQHFAMVLAGPTRLQRFTITDDKFTRVGEPTPITLERGPNRNDLTLLPSGRVAAVLRRPKAKSPQWSLQLYDLDSGEVRVMWGEVESQVRPRLHVIDDQRALLEDGSGSGFWIDLQGGVVMPAPFELPKLLEELPPESHVTTRKVTLPGSGQSERRHASVVAGLRVVPAGLGLIFDPLDSVHHHRVAYRDLGASNIALDPTGTQLAISTSDGKVLVESLTTGDEQIAAGCQTGAIEFSDPDHLVIVGHEGAQICAWRTGEVVSSVELPARRDSSMHLGAPGSGEIGVRLVNEPPKKPPKTDDDDDDDDDDDSYDSYDSGPDRLSRLTFADNRFGVVEPIPEDAMPSWPEIGTKDTKFLALDTTGQRYSKPKVDTRHFEISKGTDERRKLRISDHELEFIELLPSDDGRLVALVHEPHEEPSPYEYESYYSDYTSPPRTLSVWSIAGEVPERLWSTKAEFGLELSWSADGSRLALAEQGSVRVVTAAGEIVFERSQRELELEELPDEPSAVTPAPAP